MSSGKRRRPADGTMQIDRSVIAEQMTMVQEKQPCFVVIGGLDVGKVIPFKKEELIFGRDPDNDIVLRDDGISRHHVRVVRHGPNAVLLQDLDSTNGTFVAGRRITQILLQDGDKVLVGRRTILKFQLQDEIDQTYQKQIYESSTRDGLTGAFNRKYFAQRMVSEISFSRRHKLPLTLAIFDLDHFKRVNDTYGHRTGDQVLVTVSSAVMEMIRAEDVFARYGGEEFAVIAQGVGAEGGAIVGERIRELIEGQRIQRQDDPTKVIQVTVSVGVSTVPPGMVAEPAVIVGEADRNLYQAKESGRNRVVCTVLAGS